MLLMGVTDEGRREIASYVVLRRMIGLLGVSLPVMLAVGSAITHTEIPRSISAYYGTPMRDELVGVLLAIGFFFYAYEGHDVRDLVAGKVAWLGTLGVALFPITGKPWVQDVHVYSAAILLGTLAVFSLYLFRLSGGAMTPRKRHRNRVYAVCGVIIVGCLAALAVIEHYFAKAPFVDTYKPVFLLESLALAAFGVSWFVKGETVLADD